MSSESTDFNPKNATDSETELRASNSKCNIVERKDSPSAVSKYTESQQKNIQLHRTGSRQFINSPENVNPDIWKKTSIPLSQQPAINKESFIPQQSLPYQHFVSIDEFSKSKKSFIREDNESYKNSYRKGSLSNVTSSSKIENSAKPNSPWSLVRNKFPINFQAPVRIPNPNTTQISVPTNRNQSTKMLPHSTPQINKNLSENTQPSFLSNTIAVRTNNHAMQPTDFATRAQAPNAEKNRILPMTQPPQRAENIVKPINPSDQYESRSQPLPDSKVKRLDTKNDGENIVITKNSSTDKIAGSISSFPEEPKYSTRKQSVSLESNQQKDYQRPVPVSNLPVQNTVIRREPLNNSQKEQLNPKLSLSRNLGDESVANNQYGLKYSSGRESIQQRDSSNSPNEQRVRDFNQHTNLQRMNSSTHPQQITGINQNQPRTFRRINSVTDKPPDIGSTNHDLNNIAARRDSVTNWPNTNRRPSIEVPEMNTLRRESIHISQSERVQQKTTLSGIQEDTKNSDVVRKDSIVNTFSPLDSQNNPLPNKSVDNFDLKERELNKPGQSKIEKFGTHYNEKRASITDGNLSRHPNISQRGMTDLENDSGKNTLQFVGSLKVGKKYSEPELAFRVEHEETAGANAIVSNKNRIQESPFELSRRDSNLKEINYRRESLEQAGLVRKDSTSNRTLKLSVSNAPSENTWSIESPLPRMPIQRDTNDEKSAKFPDDNSKQGSDNNTAGDRNINIENMRIDVKLDKQTNDSNYKEVVNGITFINIENRKVQSDKTIQPAPTENNNSAAGYATNFQKVCFIESGKNNVQLHNTRIIPDVNDKRTEKSVVASSSAGKEKEQTPNGNVKSPLKIPNLKKETSCLKTPTKSLSPKSPEGSTTSSVGVEKKKVPMNKIQVGSAPSPNLKVVRSKIGSLQNSSHKPGGGKVKIENRKLEWKAQPRIEAKNETYTPGGGDKKIEHKKLQWNAKPRIGSLENSTHKPGGGDKKIESLKLEFKDKAKPKIGSKDNIKHTPGGGTVKTSIDGDHKSINSDIEDQKIEIKAQSKIGSLDNVKHRPGGGDKKIFDDKQYLKQLGSESPSLNSQDTQHSKEKSNKLSIEINEPNESTKKENTRVTTTKTENTDTNKKIVSQEKNVTINNLNRTENHQIEAMGKKEKEKVTRQLPNDLKKKKTDESNIETTISGSKISTNQDIKEPVKPEIPSGDKEIQNKPLQQKPSEMINVEHAKEKVTKEVVNKLSQKQKPILENTQQLTKGVEDKSTLPPSYKTEESINKTVISDPKITLNKPVAQESVELKFESGFEPVLSQHLNQMPSRSNYNNLNENEPSNNKIQSEPILNKSSYDQRGVLETTNTQELFQGSEAKPFQSPSYKTEDSNNKPPVSSAKIIANKQIVKEPIEPKLEVGANQVLGQQLYHTPSGLNQEQKSALETSNTQTLVQGSEAKPFQSPSYKTEECNNTPPASSAKITPNKPAIKESVEPKPENSVEPVLHQPLNQIPSASNNTNLKENEPSNNKIQTEPILKKSNHEQKPILETANVQKLIEGSEAKPFQSPSYKTEESINTPPVSIAKITPSKPVIKEPIKPKPESMVQPVLHQPLNQISARSNNTDLNENKPSNNKTQCEPILNKLSTKQKPVLETPNTQQLIQESETKPFQSPSYKTEESNNKPPVSSAKITPDKSVVKEPLEQKSERKIEPVLSQQVNQMPLGSNNQNLNESEPSNHKIQYEPILNKSSYEPKPILETANTQKLNQENIAKQTIAYNRGNSINKPYGSDDKILADKEVLKRPIESKLSINHMPSELNNINLKQNEPPERKNQSEHVVKKSDDEQKPILETVSTQKLIRESEAKPFQPTSYKTEESISGAKITYENQLVKEPVESKCENTAEQILSKQLNQISSGLNNMNLKQNELTNKDSNKDGS